jgi:uncharacterized protein (TIGR02145 family)
MRRFLISAVLGIVAATAAHAQEQGVTIGGVAWATRNVGGAGRFVDKPEDYGALYRFEQALGVCPDGWRLPTREEQKALAAAWKGWTTVNEVNGRLFGSDGDTIFLPAAGFRISRKIGNRGRTGWYWSSDPLDRAVAYKLHFNAETVQPNSESRDARLSVRCVKSDVKLFRRKNQNKL